MCLGVERQERARWMGRDFGVGYSRVSVAINIWRGDNWEHPERHKVM